MSKRKVPCIYYLRDGKCSNKKTKKSFFGLGSRYCCEVGYMSIDCNIKVKPKKPKVPPSPIPKR